MRWLFSHNRLKSSRNRKRREKQNHDIRQVYQPLLPQARPGAASGAGSTADGGLHPAAHPAVVPLGHQRHEPWAGGGQRRNTALYQRSAFAAHLSADDLDRGAHGHRALSVARLLLRLGGAGHGGPAGADVRPQPEAVSAVLSGEQGRQPDEPVHQRPRHHSGVLWRRRADVLRCADAGSAGPL